MRKSSPVRFERGAIDIGDRLKVFFAAGFTASTLVQTFDIVYGIGELASTLLMPCKDKYKIVAPTLEQRLLTRKCLL